MEYITIVNILIAITIWAIVLLLKPLIKADMTTPLRTTRSVRNPGYVDFSGGRLTEINTVDHRHLWIKTIKDLHGEHTPKVA